MLREPLYGLHSTAWLPRACCVSWPTGGFVVCEFTLADVWDAIEIRGMLEGTAMARLAAERLKSESDLSALRDLYWQQLEKIIPLDAAGFLTSLDLNEAFHAEIWRLADSPMLMRAIEQVVKLPFAAPSALVFGQAGVGVSGPPVVDCSGTPTGAIIEAIANGEGHSRREVLARGALPAARAESGSYAGRLGSAEMAAFPGGSPTSLKTPRLHELTCQARKTRTCGIAVITIDNPPGTR